MPFSRYPVGYGRRRLADTYSSLSVLGRSIESENDVSSARKLKTQTQLAGEHNEDASWRTQSGSKPAIEGLKEHEWADSVRGVRREC